MNPYILGAVALAERAHGLALVGHRLIAWVRIWWHCLLRTHLGHRMSSVKTSYNAWDMLPGYADWETTWIGCDKCGATFYGSKDEP